MKIITAIRPKTLIASVSPILIGTSMAVYARHFNFWIFLFTLLTGLGIQITTNVANDLFDFIKGADTEMRKGPVRVTQSGLMSVKQVAMLTCGFAALTLLFGIPLIFQGGPLMAFFLLLSLVCAIGYTAGPYPIAYMGLSEVFIFVFFGLLACAGSYYLQTLTWSFKPFIAGVAPGLISSAILVINNLRDVEEDRVANKKTLIVRFGTRFGKLEYASCLILASAIPFFLKAHHLYVTLAAVIILPAFLLIRAVFQNTDVRAYNPLLGKTGKLLGLYTLIFCLGYLL